MDNTNEYFILLSGYAIMLFSGWIYDFEHDRDSSDDVEVPDDLQLRYNLGFFYIGFLLFSVAINLVIVLFEIGKMLGKKNRQRVYKLKIAQALKIR